MSSVDKSVIARASSMPPKSRLRRKNPRRYSTLVVGIDDGKDRRTTTCAIAIKPKKMAKTELVLSFVPTSHREQKGASYGRPLVTFIRRTSAFCPYERVLSTHNSP